MADFNQAIAKLLEKEGGYVNDKDDPGGETKYGISKRAYPHLNIKELTKSQAEQIYRLDYWNKFTLDEQPNQVIAELIFENAVNMGVGACSALLSLVKDELKPIEAFIVQYKLYQIIRYKEICNRRPASRKYLLGWLNRVLN